MSSTAREKPTSPSYVTLRSAFSGAAAGVVISSLEGEVLHHNSAFAKILGRSQEEIAKANIFDLTHPEDQSNYQLLLADLLALRRPGFVIEKRYVRPDGSSAWVRNSVSLIGEEQTGPRHLISICEDIYRFKLAEQALKNQEHLAALGRLTSSIVHEIRNPLEAAFNLVFLARNSADLDEARKYLVVAEEEIGHAATIAAQGLELHRQASVPIPTDLADLLKSVLVLLKSKLDRSGIHLEFQHSANSPNLMCFPREIRQVCVNLITNAIDAMPEGGDLRIRLRPGCDWRTDRAGVRLTIADKGIGIDPRMRRKIYEAFFTTKGSAGSGLGLWVTANIVKKHQGSIHFRSSNEPGHRGTAFTVIFPIGGAEGKKSGFSESDN